MAVTLTPNFGLNKPDTLEDMENWATQNGSDCDTVDAVATVTTGSYTPGLFATITNPTLGNSTISGHWVKPVPNFIWVWVTLSIGSTFNQGDGLYRFGLPEDAHALYDRTGSTCGGVILGKAVWRNADNITSSRTGVCQLATVLGGGDTALVNDEEGNAQVGTNFAFAENDRLRFGLGYVTAA